MNNKVIVWDLFGGGQNSIFHALKKKRNLEIFTFDVVKPIRKKQIILDLSQNNIISKLSKFPKPDIIVSSTLCQSFSCVLNMKGGGTCFWKIDKKKINLFLERKKSSIS